MENRKKCVIMKTEFLCKSYVSDGEINNVIKNIDLEIYKEDFTVIMGSSGSGKSTLLYLLSGMLEATGGTVRLLDRTLTGLKEKELSVVRKNQIGFVFQAINLIPELSVYENILSPAYKSKIPKEKQQERALQLAEAVGLQEHLKKFPSQLSGGQRQRTAICRAIMNEPEILFADEPTGALNSSQGQNVLDLMTEIHEKGQAVVMVTHDLKAALRGNRILYLADGRIDGDLRLNSYSGCNLQEREKLVYEFLKERGW
ncbi:MAG: ABC transporter ATP-binding protein [Lachnospiraceae bacterium]